MLWLRPRPDIDSKVRQIVAPFYAQFRERYIGRLSTEVLEAADAFVARIDGYFTGPATDTLAGDITFHFARQGRGYGTNLATGTDTVRDFDDLAVRTKLLWEPTRSSKSRTVSVPVARLVP